MSASSAGPAAAGESKVASGSRLEIDAGVTLPVALGGIRRILAALEAECPAVVRARAQQRPSAWNRLFPGTFADVPDLADLALTPSERRLHRESEQTYWVLNLAARTVLDVLRETGKTLVVQSAGASDLVSLRALMRAREWARLEGLDSRLSVEGWGAVPARLAGSFSMRRTSLLASLAQRMRLPFESAPTSGTGLTTAPVDAEGRFLQRVFDPGANAEERIAAAVLAIRTCFFSTNYEGALLACEQGLQLLDACGDGFSESRLRDAWAAQDSVFSSPAIEIDEESLGDAEEMRALFERSIGVVQAFTGDFAGSLESFQRGLERKLAPERRAQLHAYRALTFIKRMGFLQDARREIEAGLAELAHSPSPGRSLQEGWLRNVSALTYFQEKQLKPALHEEKLAMRCVGDLHDASATHLKINLISNVSVLQETARQYEDAIATWRRFEAISEKWGENFSKHHRYRLAGLQLQAQQRDEAVENYVQAYASSQRLGDPFHGQVIAAELGQLHLSTENPQTAAEWFVRAQEHARELGEPLKIAQVQAGLDAAVGDAPSPAVFQALAADSTWPKESARLTEALADAKPEAVAALLPRPKSKLNRPFDAVNLY